jgi:hypothetical protein
MCGIVGLIAKKSSGFYAPEADIFTDMLLMNQVRGLDGTGCFGVYQNKQAYLTKQGTNASNFVELMEYDKFKSKITRSFNMVFGHNRKATVGQISSANSHPFLEDNIILIHNGYIGNAQMFDQKAAVDSQALARGLNNKPAKEVLESIVGAYALVWYDKRDKTLRIARNPERPLWIAETERLWMVASEPWMLAGAAGPARRGHSAIKIGKASPLDPHVMLEFQTGEEFTATEYRPKAWGTTVQHNYAGMCESECGDGYPFVDRPSNLSTDKDKAVVAPALETRATNEPTSDIRQVWTRAIAPYAVGKELEFKVTRLQRILNTATNQPFVATTGNVVFEGVQIDITGDADWTGEVADIADSTEKDSNGDNWLSGTVVSSGVTVNGPWIRLKDVVGPTMVELWNRRRVPQTIWKRVASHHKCNDCAALIQDAEQQFTSVELSTTKGIGRVFCANCVMKRFNRAEKKDETQETRIDAVQDGERILAPSSSTLN